MNIKDYLLPLIIIPAGLLFLVISALVFFSNGRSARLIKYKLKLGAILLTLGWFASVSGEEIIETGCYVKILTPPISKNTIYIPYNFNHIKLNFENPSKRIQKAFFRITDLESDETFYEGEFEIFNLYYAIEQHQLSIIADLPNQSKRLKIEFYYYSKNGFTFIQEENLIFKIRNNDYFTYAKNVGGIIGGLIDRNKSNSEEIYFEIKSINQNKIIANGGADIFEYTENHNNKVDTLIGYYVRIEPNQKPGGYKLLLYNKDEKKKPFKKYSYRIKYEH